MESEEVFHRVKAYDVPTLRFLYSLHFIIFIFLLLLVLRTP